MRKDGTNPSLIDNARRGDVVTLKLNGSTVSNHVAFVLELSGSRRNFAFLQRPARLERLEQSSV